ncbi:MAG TPA: hypothetical protein VE825_12680 [Terriglobales bacterium]|nr:hypothetical protein [Terriglobales bacterium]
MGIGFLGCGEDEAVRGRLSQRALLFFLLDVVQSPSHGGFRGLLAMLPPAQVTGAGHCQDGQNRKHEDQEQNLHENRAIRIPEAAARQRRNAIDGWQSKREMVVATGTF